MLTIKHFSVKVRGCSGIIVMKTDLTELIFKVMGQTLSYDFDFSTQIAKTLTWHSPITKVKT